MKCNMKPRDNLRLFTRPFNKDEKEPWSIPISLFAPFMDDNEELEGKLFENDWKNMKCPYDDADLVKNIKKELKRGYQIIRHCYKYFSSLGPLTGGSAWYVGYNSLIEFLKMIRIHTNEQVQVQADVDFNAISPRKIQKTRELWVSNDTPATTPTNGLIRCKFLEFVMRTGIKKYDKETETPDEAIKKMIDNHFTPIFELGQEALKQVEGSDAKLPTEPASKWRRKKYWCERVDNVYKSHSQIFKKLFDVYKNPKMKPNEEPFLKCSDFENFCQLHGFICDTFGPRDIAIIFN